MSHIAELCFELTVPYPPQLKSAYFKISTTSFVLQEVLKDINRIVHNSDHPQVQQYTEALLKYKRIKCWFYLFLLLLLIIVGIWAIYMFLLCGLLPPTMQHCDYSSYSHNIVNQVAWTLFIIVSVTTVSLISCGCGWFTIKSKHISQEWRISVKKSIHRNIATRRKKSPQYLFELNYRGIIGFVIVRKGAGLTPTVDSSSKDYSFDTKRNKKRPKRRTNLKMKNIEIESVSGYHDTSQELVHLNARTPVTPVTPDEERRHTTPHQHQMSPEMLQEYARQNNSMLNALINAPSNPRLIANQSNSRSQNLSVHVPYNAGGSQPNLRMNANPRQQATYEGGGGSQPNLVMNQIAYHTQPGAPMQQNMPQSYSMVNLNASQPAKPTVHSSSQPHIDAVTQPLPPVIPNPVDLDALNQPIHHQNNHRHGY